MCELFAMSSKFPTDVNLSLQEFSRHGGGSGPHVDGWGIAYSMGNDFRIIKEPEAAYDSDCVRYIRDHLFSSRLVVSHIRRASPPKVLSYENTHPFDRELFGRRFIFAHNGQVEGIRSLPGLDSGQYFPMGGTDSEKIFCLLLNSILRRVGKRENYHYRRVEEVLMELSPQIRSLGVFNYLLSDSEYLFAHGDRSLYSVCRSCHLEEAVLQTDDLRVLLTHGPEQEAAIVATIPLTEDSHWSRFESGEIRIFHHGRQI